MADTKLKDKELEKRIRGIVIETLREIMEDPDYGLPLTQETIKRLRKSEKSKKAGRLIPLEKIKKKYLD